MNIFVLDDHVIKNIINSLAVEDNVRKIIENIILKYDHNFINFIYNIFSTYTTYYIQVLSKNSQLSTEEINVILQNLKKINPFIKKSDVFITDIYDILCINTSFDKLRFNHYFYEDIYNRLETLLGTTNATKYAEEIFDTIEIILLIIEKNIVFNIIKQADLESIIILYLELTPQRLIIFVDQSN